MSSSIAMPKSFNIGLAVFGMAIALAWSGDIWWTEQCLKTSPRQAAAVVTDKRVNRGKNTSYHLDFAFMDTVGQRIIGTERVSFQLFNRVALNGTVPVTYCGTNAARHTLDLPRLHGTRLAMMWFGLSIGLGLGVYLTHQRLTSRPTNDDREPMDPAWTDMTANRFPPRVR